MRQRKCNHPKSMRWPVMTTAGDGKIEAHAWCSRCGCMMLAAVNRYQGPKETYWIKPDLDR